MKEYKKITIVKKNSSDETNLIVNQDDLIDISDVKRSDILDIKYDGCLSGHAMFLPKIVKGHYVKWHIVRDSEYNTCLVPVKINPYK